MESQPDGVSVHAVMSPRSFRHLESELLRAVPERAACQRREQNEVGRRVAQRRDDVESNSV